MIKKIAFFFFSLLLVYSCNTPTQKTNIACVNPPIKNVAVKYNTYEVNAQAGQIIKLPNKGSIIIPPTAFVDKEGKPVLGTVKIFYREFRTMGDIVVSGIPMSYDSAGVKLNFESAGMFEIWGAQNNIPVYIAPGKSIAVNMLSTRIGDNYNFYALDTIAKNWEYKGTAKPILQIDSLGGDTTATVSVDSIAESAPPAMKKDAMVFDLNFKTKGQNEDMQDLRGILWQYAGDKKEEDPELQPWIFTTKWTDVKLKLVDSTKLIYQLNLSSPKKSFTSYITPSFSEKNYKESVVKFKRKIVKYNKRALQKREGDLIRSFQVNQFGVYNWDRYLKDRPCITVKLKIKFKQSADERTASVFNVISGQGMVIRYTLDEDLTTSFKFFSEEDNTLLILMSDGETAYISPAEFSAMNMINNGTYDINIGETAKVRSASDIDALLSKK